MISILFSTLFDRKVCRYQSDKQKPYKPKKDRQYNGRKKKDKKTNNDHQTLHRKLKIEIHLKQGVNSSALEG